MQFPDALSVPNTYCGVGISQTWQDLALWEVFFDRTSVGSVLELGTFQGGTTLFFAMQGKARGFQVASIDSNAYHCQHTELLKSFDCELINMDLLDSSSIDEIRSILDRLPKPTVLFCDNGNKPSEWNRFVPLLAHGDFAAVHDWGTEFHPHNLDPHPDAYMEVEAESIQSMTRYFKI